MMNYGNSFSPVRPSDMDWSQFYEPDFADGKKIEFLDVGCGYGGLLGAAERLVVARNSRA